MVGPTDGPRYGSSLRVVFPKLGLLNALLPVTHKLIFGVLKYFE